MKKGDKLEVAIAGAVVGYAEVEAIADETVTILIPAQRVVARKKVQLDLTPEQSEGAGTVVLTDGVESPEEMRERMASGAADASVTAQNNETVVVPPETPVEPTAPPEAPDSSTVETND